MTAQEFVLIPKHIYVREHPHAGQFLLDNFIKHKKPQLSYLNRLKPSMQQQLILHMYQSPKHLSMPLQTTINKNKLYFSLMTEEINGKQVLSLMTLYPLNVLYYNYNSWTKTNLSVRKKFWKLLKIESDSQ